MIKNWNFCEKKNIKLVIKGAFEENKHPSFLLQNGADVKWVDGGKAIFKVSTNVVSTVYTQVGPHVCFCSLCDGSAMCPRYAPQFTH